MSGTNKKDFFESFRNNKLKRIADIPTESNTVNVGGKSLKRVSDLPADMSGPIATTDIPKTKFKSAQSKALGVPDDEAEKQLGNARTEASRSITEQDVSISDDVKGVINSEIQSNKKVLIDDFNDLMSKAPDWVSSHLRSLGMDKDEYVKRITDTGNQHSSSGLNELKEFANSRFHLLDMVKDKKTKELRASVSDYRGYANAPREEVELANQQIKEVEQNYEDQKKQISNAVFNLAALKIIDAERTGGVLPENINPYEVGKKVKEIIEDPLIYNKEKRKWEQGIEDPAERVQRGMLGYRAMQLSGMDLIANGQEEYGKNLLKLSQNTVRKIIDDNPEYRKIQVRSALADDIYNNKKSWLSWLTGTSVDQEDIAESAKRLGIPESDLEGVVPEDIKRQPDLVSNLAGGLAREGSNLVEAAARHIVNPIMELSGADAALSPDELDDLFKQGWYDNTQIGRMFKGASPNAATVQANRAANIDTNPGSTDYLMHVEKAGDESLKFNVNSIANLMVGGTAQILSNVVGGSTIGAALRINPVTGQAIYNYIAGYDRNKSAAKEVILGDSAVDEMKRIALANIYTGVEVVAEQILPDVRMSAFTTAAGKKLISEIQKEGVEAITKPKVVRFATDAIKQTIEESGKEGLEEFITPYGQAIGDMFFAPEKFFATDYNKEAVEQGLLGAISSIIPTGAGGLRYARDKGNMRKSLLFDIGKNPSVYIDEISKEVSTGTITEAEGDARIETVNNLSEIIKFEVPDVSPISGLELTETEKIDYANSLLAEKMLTDMKSKVTDPVQSERLDEMILDEQEQRKVMLSRGTQDRLAVEDNAQENVPVQEAETDLFGLQKDAFVDEEALNESISQTSFEEQQGVLPAEDSRRQLLVDMLDKHNADLNETVSEIEALKVRGLKEGDGELDQLVRVKGYIEDYINEKTNALNQLDAENEIITPEPVSYFEPLTDDEVEISAQVGDNVKQKFSEATKLEGSKFNRTLPNGEKLNGKYVVVDAFAMTPSNNYKTFATNEGIPTLEGDRNPNDRNYTQEDNQRAVIKRAGEYDGRAVTEVPIVDKNGVVLSGNDRTMSGQLAAENKTDRDYIDNLTENAAFFGIDPNLVTEMVNEGKNPRLVFVPDTILPYDTSTYAKFNDDPQKAKNNIEEVITYSRTIDDNALRLMSDKIQDHESMAEVWKDLPAQKALAKELSTLGILTVNNTGKYFNDKQGFTDAGKNLLVNVLSSKVLDEDAVYRVQKHKSIKNKLAKNIKAISDIANNSEVPIKKVLSDAIYLIDLVEQYMRDNNLPIKKVVNGKSVNGRIDALTMYLREQKLFEDRDTEVMAEAMYTQLLGTPTQFKEYINNVAQDVTNNKDIAGLGEDLFGDVPPSKAELLTRTIKNIEEHESEVNAGTPAEQSLQEPTPEASGPTDVGGDERNVQETGDVTQEAEEAGLEEPGAIESDANNSMLFIEADIPQVEEETPPENTELKEATDEYNKYNKFVIKKEANMERLVDAGKTDSIDYQKEFQAWQQYKRKRDEAQKRLRSAQTQKVKSLADNVRKYKIDKPNDGMILSATPVAAIAKMVEVLGRNIYNAAVETVALSLEKGNSIRNAIQEGVDYINDRWFTKWPQAEFEELMGVNDSVEDVTADNVRKKLSDSTGLSEKQRNNADQIVNYILANKESLRTAINYVRSLNGVSDRIKSNLVKYITGRVNHEIFYNDGREWADRHIESSGTIAGAIESLSDEVDVLLKNSESIPERENIRSRKAAALTYLQSKMVDEGIQSGDIKPQYAMDEDPEKEKNIFIPPDRTNKDRLQEYVHDKYKRLDKIEKAVPKQTSNPLLAFRLKNSKAGYHINNIQEYLGNREYVKGSFFDRLKNAGIDLQQFGMYLYALHAPERNAHNAELREKMFEARLYQLNRKLEEAMTELEGEEGVTDDNLVGMGEERRTNKRIQKIEQKIQDLLDQKDSRFVKMPDGGSGMTNEQAADIIKEVEADGKKDVFDEFVAEFRENVVDKILDFKYDSGLIDEQTYNQLTSFYENYVPLKVDMDEVGAEETYAGGDINGRDLYRSKGAVDIDFKMRFNPVLQSIIDFETSVTLSEENKANQKLARMIKDNPNDNFWQVVPAKFDVVKDEDGNVLYGKEVGSKPENAQDVYIDGKKHYIVLNDEGLKNVFKKHKPNMVFNVARNVSRFMTAISTLYNPNFIMKNAIIDVQDAGLSLRNQKKEVLSNFRSYYKKALALLSQLIAGGKIGKEWEGWIEEWRQNGGEISFLHDIDNKKHSEETLKMFDHYGNKFSKAQFKRIHSSFKRFSSGFEQLSRVMAYRAARESGINPEQAALISRNATIDFERKGVWGAYINAFKAFANAGIQGNVNLFYSLLKSRRAQKFLGFMVIAGMAESIFNNMLGDCKDPTGENCYWEKPEWEKRKNFIIPLSIFGGKGFAQIPIGRQFAWFKYIGNNIVDGAVYGKKDATETFKDLVESFFDLYNLVGGTAPIEQQMTGNLSPLTQFFTGKNSMGYDIWPEHQEWKPDHEIHYATTPEEYVNTAQWISDMSGGEGHKPGMFDVSPETLEWMTNVVGGGLYNFAWQGYETTSDLVTGDDVQMKKVPFLNIFYRENNMSQTKQTYDKLSDKASQEVLSADDMKELEDALDRLVDSGDIDKKKKRKRMDFIKREQSKIKKFYKEDKDE